MHADRRHAPPRLRALSTRDFALDPATVAWVRLVATRRVEGGTVLARDIMDGRPGAIPLLRAGVKVTARHRTALIAAGVHAVYVDDALSEGIEVRGAITEETRQRATQTVSRAFDGCREAMGSGHRLPDAVLKDLQKVADMIAGDIEENADVAVALDDLAASDGYTLQHSIDVAAVGMLVGQRLFRESGWIDHLGRRVYDRRERRLARLGLGLLLHDVGKLMIPADVLNKPGKLDDAEWELMRAHPRAGVEMLRSDLISPLVKVVVRSHHERWDGGGYPDGLSGEGIHQLARIAATADVYDAVTSERAYAPARPPDVGVQIVLEGTGRAFDPDVVDVFRRVVSPYPPGCEVALSDGRRGVVASVPQEDLTRPVVRVGWDTTGRKVAPYDVDTLKSGELTLSGVAAPGVPSREVGPPPLPTQPEPSPELVAEGESAVESAARSRAGAARAARTRAWR